MADLSFQDLVQAEVKRARKLHAPYNSLHESYAVILEEMDEFWDEVKKKTHERRNGDVLKELVQIAATVQRCAEDCGLMVVDNG